MHLADLYPQANFTLVEANEIAISLARKSSEKCNATCKFGDIYNLAFDFDSCDLLIC